MWYRIFVSTYLYNFLSYTSAPLTHYIKSEQSFSSANTVTEPKFSDNNMTKSFCDLIFTDFLSGMWFIRAIVLWFEQGRALDFMQITSKDDCSHCMGIVPVFYIGLKCSSIICLHCITTCILTLFPYNFLLFWSQFS